MKIAGQRDNGNVTLKNACTESSFMLLRLLINADILFSIDSLKIVSINDFSGEDDLRNSSSCMRQSSCADAQII